MRVPITRQNVSRLTSIFSPVRGRLFDAAWSPDGNSIAVGTASGLWLYDMLQPHAPRPMPTNGRVQRVVFSPDGNYLAYLETDGLDDKNRIILRSVLLDTEITTLPTHDIDLSFTPDSACLIYVPDKAGIALWDIASQKNIQLIPGGCAPLAIDPTGEWLVVGGMEGSNDDPTYFLTLWNLLENKAVRRIDAPPKRNSIGEWFRFATFSPDGKQIIVSYGEGGIYSVDTKAGTALRNFPLATGGLVPHRLVYSPDGSLIAFAGSDGYGEVYQATLWNNVPRIERANLARIIGMESAGNALAFSPNGSQLLFDTGRGRLHIWDINAGHDLGLIGGNDQGVIHTDEIQDLDFSPDDKTLAVVSGIYRLQLWDMESGQQRVSVNYSNSVKNLGFSPDGSRLVGSSGRPYIKVWDVSTGQEITTLPADTNAAIYSRDGHWIASGGHDANVTIWDAQSFTVKHRLNHPGDVYDVAISPDGKLAVSAGGDFLMGEGRQENVIVLWDVETGQQRAILRGHQACITRMIFSPDGARLASMSGNAHTQGENTFWLWDVATGTAVAQLVSHATVIVDIAFSPDGQLLASAGRNGAIDLWNGKTGAEKRSMTGPKGQGSAIAFSPNGTLLVLVGFSRDVSFWNPQTGEKVHQLQVNLPTSLAFSHDGTLLAVGGFDGTVHIWGVSRYT